MSDKKVCSNRTEEHPAIFNGWSIGHILADEKTHTRRIADYPQFKNCGPDGGWWPVVNTADTPFGDETPVECPYGQPGDVLWVREAFRLPECYDHLSPREYVDDTSIHAVKYEAHQPYDKQYGGYRWGRKRPSIYLPYELCRLRLRVGNVWVERVQEISNEDAVAEGVRGFWCDKIQGYDIPDVAVVDGPPRRAFAYIWEDIHGDGAWERNDWVWIIEFSKISDTSR